MNLEDYIPRVAAGATWLDKVEPDWWNKVSLSTLDMDDGCLCVVGQLEGMVDGDGDDWTRPGPYTRFMERHGMDVKTQRALGLLDEPEWEQEDAFDDLAMLHGLWSIAILRRRRDRDSADEAA